MTFGDPPHDALAEQAVIGGMMLSEKAITDVTAILTATEFYRPVHAKIFTVITDLALAGETVDPVTVGAELDRRGELMRVGGAPYLYDLMTAPPTPASAAAYAKIVAEKARLRSLGELGARFQKLAYTDGVSGPDVDELLAHAEKFFRSQHEESSSALSFDELIAVWQDDQGSNKSAIPTPWPDLNRMLNGGAHRGKMITIGGRPGSGKSLLGLNASAFASERDFHALVFSLEMGDVEVAARLLAAGGRASFGQLVRRSMDLETCQKIEAYVAVNAGMPLTVIDQERVTVEQITAHCRATRPSVVFVDYLQLLTATDPKAPREQQISHMSRSLKILAKELDIAVYVGAQLNRGPAGGDGKGRLPQISDLRESGAIEQDSDVVLLLHRDPADEGIVKVIVGKNRNGQRGIVELPFRGEMATIG